MWRSHGFPKKVIYKCYDFLMFLYTGYGYIVTLPELPGSMRITSVYMGILKKMWGVFRFPQVFQPCFWCLSQRICRQVFVWLTTWWLADATRASLLFLERAVAEQPVSGTPGLMAVRSYRICAVLNVQCSVYIYIRETIYNKENMI